MRTPIHARGPLEAPPEYLAEVFSLARIYAEQAQSYAEIGDNTGLRYATRKLAAYVKAAAGTLSEMPDMGEAQ